MAMNLDSSQIFPIYERIEFALMAAISSGRISADEQFPSVRDLAVQFEVNPNTITKALRSLELREMIYSRRGMGVFVHADAIDKARNACNQNILGLIQLAKERAFNAGIDFDAI